MPPRKRVYQRSRTGCHTCRLRRVRCDETRPSCMNCVSRKRPCSYAPVEVPVRERKSLENFLPGEQAPWAIGDGLNQLSLFSPNKDGVGTVVEASQEPLMNVDVFLSPLPGHPLDPFDSLPIKLSFKSKELLHYYFQVGASLGIRPEHVSSDSLTQCPHHLRNTLLIAGAHYAWNLGDLGSFKSTFLLHKVENIQLVNSWLVGGQTSPVAQCANHIATLCLVESCLGDLAVADAHLVGLIRFLEMRWPEPQDDDLIGRSQHELFNRYFIMACNFVHSFRSRLQDFLMSESDLSSPPRRPSPKNITRLIHDWHLHEATGISLRLKAMRMITSFFSPPDPDRIPQVVDVNDIIERVRNITRITDQRLSRETDASPYELWNSGDTSHLLHAILNAHLDSYLDREPDMHSAEPMMSSWTGACIAVGMYLISILGVWNRGEVPEVRRLFYGLNILDRDLRNRTLDSLPAESRHSRLWFWKAIVGAISIRHAQTHLASAGVLEERAEELSKTLEGFGQAFGEHIRTWAGGHGVCEWVEARNLLYQIAWPKQCPKDGMARSVWERTLSALL